MKGIPPHGFPRTMEHGLEIVCVYMCVLINSEQPHYFNRHTTAGSCFLCIFFPFVQYFIFKK